MKQQYSVAISIIVICVCLAQFYCSLFPAVEEITPEVKPPRIEQIPQSEPEEEAIDYIPQWKYNVSEDWEDNTIEISYEDAQILMKIAQAEAGTEGAEGMALVMAVVLNRVEDERFPNTIKEVVFQNNPVQFTPTVTGSYDRAIPTSDCHIALAMIEMGEYSDIDALYFNNGILSGHTYLYTVGNHNFYR